MQLTIKTRKLPRRTDGVVWENSEGCSHWACTLINDDALPEDQELEFEFSAGEGHKGKAPEVKDVLPCLISDASSTVTHDSFEDFASEFDIDGDSRHQERMWEKMKTDAAALRRFLGDEEYDLAMAIGDDEYVRIRLHGEETPDMGEAQHTTEWRDLEHQGKPARVRLTYGTNLEWAEKYNSDPELQVSMQGQVKRHGVWLNQYLEVSGPEVLTERERLFREFNGMGLHQGPSHYVTNALYFYKQSIGLVDPSKDDLRKWQNDAPTDQDPVRWGARKLFLKIARHGVLENEPPFPSVTADEEGTIPLTLEEMAENMQVWLELRIPCMVDRCHKMMHEFGMEVDRLIGRADGIAVRRRAAGTPQPKPKPKLIHTIVPQDVGRNRIERTCCGGCGTKQPAIYLSDSIGRVQTGDIGKRVYLVWAHANTNPIVQVENDEQLKKRLARRTVTT